MANIPLAPFALGVSPKITPSNAGPAAYAAIAQAKEKTGAALDADFTQIGNTVGTFVEQHQQAQQQKELSAGAASYATGIYSQTEAWNNTTSDPKFDPSTGQEMGQQAIDANNKFWDNWATQFTTPGGKAFAAEHATTAKLDFEKTVNADQGKFAADTAVTNTNTTVNTLVQHVNSDPSQLDTVLTQLPGLIEAHIPQGIPYADRAKLVTEGVQTAGKTIAFAALTKMARANPGITNPDGTPATSGFMVDVNSGKLDADMALLDPSQQAAVVGYAKAADAASQRLQITKNTAQDKQNTAAVQTHLAALYSGMHNADGSPNLAGIAAAQKAAIDDIGMPGWKGTDSSALQLQIDHAQAAADKTNKTDPNVYGDLQKRIEANDGTSPTANDIWAASGDRHLSVQDRDTLLGELKVFHPTDKPGPLDNAIDKQQYDANIGRLSAPAGVFGKTFTDASGNPLQGSALTAATNSEQEYQDWYRKSFLAGTRLGYSTPDMIYSNGAHYIDPQKYTGPDPQGQLKSGPQATASPALFDFGNTPAPTAAPAAPSAAPVTAPNKPKFSGPITDQEFNAAGK